MTTEQLPDGLQRAVNAIEWHSACCDEYKVEIDAIRAEHQQRLMLQHHAADQARRIADLETKVDTLKRLHDAVADERDELAHGHRSQHNADSAELRRVCAARDAARKERDELRARLAEIEGLKSVALDVFHATDCPQETRDAIEWYAESIIATAPEAAR